MNATVVPRLCAMMFLQFFIWGAWYVTIGNYMVARGWGDSVGDAYTVGPLAAIISPFFLGMIADRYFATQRVLGFMHLLGGGLMFLAPAVASWEGDPSGTLVWNVLLAHMLCYMPTLGLTNALAFHNIADQQKQFPIIRVFGTLGWIAANVVVSKLLHADESDLQFQVAGIASVALAAFTFALPHTPPPAAGKRVSFGEVLGLDALRLLKDRSFLVFIVSSFLICIPLAAYYSFAPVFVKDSGFEDPAFNMSFGQWAEVAFMLVMPLFFARLGVKWMLALGMLAWVARYGLFAMGADLDASWMILGGIVLHGICYDFFFVTGQIYVDQRAEREIRGQAQGFLVVMTQGFGLMIGAQVAQAIVSGHTLGEGEAAVRDWSTIWGYPTLGAAAVLLLFVALFRAPRPQSAA